MSYALHPLKLWLDCCWSIPLTCFHTYPRTWKVLWFILVFFGMHSNRKLIWEFEFNMNVTWSLVHEQHLVWYTQATHASSSTCNEQHQAGLMARNERCFHLSLHLCTHTRYQMQQDTGFFCESRYFSERKRFPHFWARSQRQGRNFMQFLVSAISTIF